MGGGSSVKALLLVGGGFPETLSFRTDSFSHTLGAFRFGQDVSDDGVGDHLARLRLVILDLGLRQRNSNMQYAAWRVLHIKQSI